MTVPWWGLILCALFGALLSKNWNEYLDRRSKSRVDEIEMKDKGVENKVNESVPVLPSGVPENGCMDIDQYARHMCQFGKHEGYVGGVEVRRLMDSDVLPVFVDTTQMYAQNEKDSAPVGVWIDEKKRLWMTDTVPPKWH